MKCDEFKNRVVDLADGTLNEAEAAAMEAHAAECGACAAEIAEVRALFSDIRGAAPEDPGELFWKKFNRQVYDGVVRETAAPATVRASRLRRRAFSGVAAAALIALTVLGYTLFAPDGDTGVEKAPKPAATASVAQKDVDIALATLGNTDTSVPHFASIYDEKNSTDSVASEKKQLDQAIDILDGNTYKTAVPDKKSITGLVNDLSDKEAEQILEELSDDGQSSIPADTGGTAS